jgi:hypothetical protein
MTISVLWLPGGAAQPGGVLPQGVTPGLSGTLNQHSANQPASQGAGLLDPKYFKNFDDISQAIQSMENGPAIFSKVFGPDPKVATAQGVATNLAWLLDNSRGKLPATTYGLLKKAISLRFPDILLRRGHRTDPPEEDQLSNDERLIKAQEDLKNERFKRHADPSGGHPTIGST